MLDDERDDKDDENKQDADQGSFDFSPVDMSGRHSRLYRLIEPAV